MVNALTNPKKKKENDGISQRRRGKMRLPRMFKLMRATPALLAGVVMAATLVPASAVAAPATSEVLFSPVLPLTPKQLRARGLLLHAANPAVSSSAEITNDFTFRDFDYHIVSHHNPSFGWIVIAYKARRTSEASASRSNGVPASRLFSKGGGAASPNLDCGPGNRGICGDNPGPVFAPPPPTPADLPHPSGSGHLGDTWSYTANDYEHAYEVTVEYTYIAYKWTLTKFDTQLLCSGPHNPYAGCK